MLREWVLLLAGLALLVTAVYLVQTKVVAIKVGEHTSRLVGIACALVAYYYFRHGFSLHLPHGGINLAAVKDALRYWAPPAILCGMGLYYAVTIFKNWRSEFIDLVHSTAWLAVVVGLIVAARFVLTQ